MKLCEEPAQSLVDSRGLRGISLKVIEQWGHIALKGVKICSWRKGEKILSLIYKTKIYIQYISRYKVYMCNSDIMRTWGGLEK